MNFVSASQNILFAAFGAAVLGVSAPGFALASGCGFLPVTFVECPSTLKPSQTAFCGVWGEQKWNDVLPHCLVVEEVAPDGSGKIVYGWGTAPQWNIHDPGYRRHDARIEGNSLKASFSRFGGWVNLEYRLDGDALHGTYSYRGRNVHITLRRFGE